MTPLDLTTMPIGARLVTRAGHSARMLANDLKADFPCLIAVDVGGYEQIHNIGSDGWVGDESAPHPHDIVAVARPRHRVRIWLVRHDDNGFQVLGQHSSHPHFANQPTWAGAVIADQIVEIEERAP